LSLSHALGAHGLRLVWSHFQFHPLHGLFSSKQHLNHLNIKLAT
jgi:hypothetical protein